VRIVGRARCFLKAWKTGSARTIPFASSTSSSTASIWPSLDSAGSIPRQPAGHRTTPRFSSPAAIAADRTIILAVKNMECAACPSIVKGNLEAVPCVAKAGISYKDKTATVTYDDAKCEPIDIGDHQGGLSVHPQELIRCFFNRP